MKVILKNAWFDGERLWDRGQHDNMDESLRPKLPKTAKVVEELEEIPAKPITPGAVKK